MAILKIRTKSSRKKRKVGSVYLVARRRKLKKYESALLKNLIKAQKRSPIKYNRTRKRSRVA